MKTTKTIEVTTCDFCVAGGSSTWPCVKCEKDACARCCSVYRIAAERPFASGIVGVSAINIGTRTASFQAIFCDDCGENELPTIFLRAGFDDKLTDVAA